MNRITKLESLGFTVRDGPLIWPSDCGATERIRYVDQTSPLPDLLIAWELGQKLKDENGYGSDPIPRPGMWSWIFDRPDAFVAILNEGREAIGMMVIEEATIAMMVEPQFEWPDSPAEVPAWSGPLVSYIYLDPAFRGQGIFRKFYLDVITRMHMTPDEVAHLPPFSDSALRFHRTETGPQTTRAGWNWRHGAR